MAGGWCCLTSCGVSSKTDPTASYHRIPKKDPERKLWLEFLRIKTATPRMTICSLHFTPSCFVVDYKSELMGTKPKRTLIAGATPTIHKPKPKSNNETDRAERIAKRVRKEMVQDLIDAATEQDLNIHGDDEHIMIQDQEVNNPGDAVQLGHVLNAVKELQKIVVAGFKNVSSKLAKLDERVKTLETAQIARDQSYIKLLKPIQKAVVKAGPYDIEWPLETLEELHAVEAQMGDFGFDNFLAGQVKKITRQNLFKFLGYEALNHFSKAGKDERKKLKESPLITLVLKSWAGSTESLEVVEAELDAMITTKRRSKATSESRKRKQQKAGTNNGCPKESNNNTIPVKKEQETVDRSLDPVENTFGDQRRPCPSDAIGNLNPLEEYWIDEGHGVSYNIKIEEGEEDVSSKRRKL